MVNIMNTCFPGMLMIVAGLLSGCSDSSSEHSTPVVQIDPVLVEGEQLYKSNCKVCHAQGINGAPIVGNAKMWAGRAGKGIPQLVANASNGFGLMPAKGGNDSLAESQIESVVTYMVSRIPVE